MGFKKAENKMAYLKMGFMGFQGSGKSYTAFLVAMGLYEYLKLEKPICLIDTENKLGLLLKKFEDRNIPFIEPEHKSMSYRDLLSNIRLAEKECSILIIDSLSAFYSQLLLDCQRKKKQKEANMYVRSITKDEWREYTDLYLNSKLHIIILGRSGWKYQSQENERGRMEVMVTGTKMRGEVEMGYEPSLLVEMEGIRGKEIGDKLVNVGYILKDSAGTGLQGQFKNNPDFDFILPHIEALNIGGAHEAYDSTRNSEDLFEHDGGGWNEKKRQREIACEELKNILTLLFNGTTADKKAKIEKLEELFGVTSFTEIEDVNSKKVTLNKILDVIQTLKEKNQKKEG